MPDIGLGLTAGLNNILNAYEGWQNYKQQQKNEQIANATKAADLYHNVVNPTANEYPAPISSQLNEAMGLSAPKPGILQRLFGIGGNEQAQTQPQAKNIPIQGKTFLPVNTTTGQTGNSYTIPPGVTAVPMGSATPILDASGNVKSYLAPGTPKPIILPKPGAGKTYKMPDGTYREIEPGQPIPEGAAPLSDVENQARIAAANARVARPNALQQASIDAWAQKNKRQPTAEERSKILTDVQNAANKGRYEQYMKAYMSARQANYLDTADNRILTLTYDEAASANKKTPGKYLMTTPGEVDKALKETALVEDIKGSIDSTQKAVDNLKNDFSETQRLKLYKAVHTTDPKSALQNLISGEFGKSLAPDQEDYLVQVKQLIEQAMAMRKVLGTGQGSDQVRRAIAETIPSAGSFSKSYSTKQLTAFAQVLERISRGIPLVKLGPGPLGKKSGGGETPGNVAKPSLMQFMRAAKALPQNKGISDSDFKKAYEQKYGGNR